MIHILLLYNLGYEDSVSVLGIITRPVVNRQDMFKFFQMQKAGFYKKYQGK